MNVDEFRKAVAKLETWEEVFDYGLQVYQHVGIARDEAVRWANLKEVPESELCEWCEGTGNELMSMYRKCPECSGKGLK